jgi:hypothetical protein
METTTLLAIVSVIIMMLIPVLVGWVLSRSSKTAVLATDPQSPMKVKTTGAPDKLTKIEGIGPKTSQLLENAGISTFAALASTGADELDDIVDAAGYTMMDVTSWPEQASLAANDRWEELKTLQDNLKGGKKA